MQKALLFTLGMLFQQGESAKQVTHLLADQLPVSWWGLACDSEQISPGDTFFI